MSFDLKHFVKKIPGSIKLIRLAKPIFEIIFGSYLSKKISNPDTHFQEILSHNSRKTTYQKHEISFIVSCYNNFNDFDYKFKNFINLTKSLSCEVIFVDDASSKIPAYLKKIHKNIIFVQHKTHAGTAATFNTGALRSSGKHLSFLRLKDDIMFDNIQDTLSSQNLKDDLVILDSFNKTNYLINLISKKLFLQERGFLEYTRSISYQNNLSQRLIKLFPNIIFKKFINLHLNTSEIKNIDHTSFNKNYFKCDILFMPHKDYHSWTYLLIEEHLKKLGICSKLLNISYLYPDEGVKSHIEQEKINHININEFLLQKISPKAILFFNDWDQLISKPLITYLKFNHIKTIGMVEGIQDFKDLDTNRSRFAYQTVEYLLLSGKYDNIYFKEKNSKCYVVGVPRVHSLLKEKVNFPTKPIVLINLNFSYNVGIKFADKWLQSIISCCEKLKIDFIISQHPSDHTDLRHYTKSTSPIYDLIKSSTLVISRFSSIILESLALGKPVIYHNPHFEKVEKFKDSMGVYDITHNSEELKLAIKKLIHSKLSIREKASNFLQIHTNSISNNPSLETAKAIHTII